MATTRKKIKVIGTQDYINPDTSEVITMNVIKVEERDANFHKIWLSHVLQSLELIGNQKIKLVFWLIDNMDSENKVCMTQRQMVKATGISLDTVNYTLKVLIENNFLIKHNIGVYKVNPDMIFKGGKNERMNVLIEYTNTKKENNQEFKSPAESKIEPEVTKAESAEVSI